MRPANTAPPGRLPRLAPRWSCPGRAQRWPQRLAAHATLLAVLGAWLIGTLVAAALHVSLTVIIGLAIAATQLFTGACILRSAAEDPAERARRLQRHQRATLGCACTRCAHGVLPPKPPTGLTSMLFATALAMPTHPRTPEELSLLLSAAARRLGTAPRRPARSVQWGARRMLRRAPQHWLVGVAPADPGILSGPERGQEEIRWAQRILAWYQRAETLRACSMRERATLEALAALAGLECLTIAHTPLRADLAEQFRTEVGEPQALRLALAIEHDTAPECATALAAAATPGPASHPDHTGTPTHPTPAALSADSAAAGTVIP